jgi:RNA polymerase sigma-70 factor (ECF subfamily)
MDWLTTSTILRDLTDASNDSAWRRLAGRFHVPILRFARKLGLTEADADDVAQETLAAFAAAYRAGRYDRAKGRLSQWLFGIAWRQAQSVRRSAARRAAVEGQVDRTSIWDQVADEADVSRTWDQEWEYASLEQCLRQVRQEVEPDTARAFELVMQPGRTPADVAKELGVDAKTVYNAKYSMLKRLRELRQSLEDLV